MIVVDIETTGLDSRIHQIVSIGAVDTETGETFYKECRIYKKDKVDYEALAVNGFTEDQVRDRKKITSKQLYDAFLGWCYGRSETLMSCNISFDVAFLRKVNFESGYEFKKFPFRRCLDLITMYYAKFRVVRGLKAMCEQLNIEPEPKIHNALNGALKAAEVFEKL
jgi:DNA polymerase-3 subunit alpha (Gram-positive type)